MTTHDPSYPLGFEERPTLTYAEFRRAYQRIIFDIWREQIACGHLTVAGALAIRSRLACGGEFEPGADRDALVWLVSDALAAMRGSEPPGIPAALDLTVPDDLSQLDG